MCFFAAKLKSTILFALLLNLQFFIFCNKKFFENLVFLTDTVADLAVRYTLCGRYTLCAHCRLFYAHELPGDFNRVYPREVNKPCSGRSELRNLTTLLHPSYSPPPTRPPSFSSTDSPSPHPEFIRNQQQAVRCIKGRSGA